MKKLILGLVAAGAVIGSGLVASAAPQASLTAMCGGLNVGLATNTPWTLSKSGELSGNVITYTVSTVKGVETSPVLKVRGMLSVTNTSSGFADVGNIIINLQKKSGKTWITASSNVANTFLGNSATSARNCSSASSESKSLFTENSASGYLNFTDAMTNTTFSVTIDDNRSWSGCYTSV